MAEFEHGDMDTREQERTFEGFMRWMQRIVLSIVVLLVLLAIFNT